MTGHVTCTPEVSSLPQHFKLHCVDFPNRFYIAMLPSAAVFHFPWEINSGNMQEGESVRTFGRLVCYQPEDSRATLSAQHASKEHHVVVHTLFVEPFNPIIGAQYIVLGEIENNKGVGVMVQARVLNCVDGVNIALLQKAISEQRSFFTERECKQSETAQPADAT
ncbi:CST complex subunit TEN1 [Acanthochromis polyacanthus]|uniref:CST complex subunit TEN1 n=1 Tax=Acanthochromis polyacanthus TaxID=80966 RepID=A0A3Q1GAL0_9TELE|nr:CST complex subunit TEN1 [Acanthochromis polyacanthus]